MVIHSCQLSVRLAPVFRSRDCKMFPGLFPAQPLNMYARKNLENSACARFEKKCADYWFERRSSLEMPRNPSVNFDRKLGNSKPIFLHSDWKQWPERAPEGMIPFRMVLAARVNHPRAISQHFCLTAKSTWRTQDIKYERKFHFFRQGEEKQWSSFEEVLSFRRLKQGREREGSRCGEGGDSLMFDFAILVQFQKGDGERKYSRVCVLWSRSANDSAICNLKAATG